MVELIEMLAPKGAKCRSGYALTPKYITIHNTANASAGAGAINHAKYLQGTGKDQSVSYHYAVDSGLIARIIPDSEVAWHAGDGISGTGNRQSLAIEICENPESDLFTATNNAAELTAHLLKDYSLSIDKVVQHNKWSGKDCPHRIRIGEPYSWAEFINRVQKYRAALDKPKTNYAGKYFNVLSTFKTEYFAAPNHERLNGLGFLLAGGTYLIVENQPNEITIAGMACKGFWCKIKMQEGDFWALSFDDRIEILDELPKTEPPKVEPPITELPIAEPVDEEKKPADEKPQEQPPAEVPPVEIPGEEELPVKIEPADKTPSEGPLTGDEKLTLIQLLIKILKWLFGRKDA